MGHGSKNRGHRGIAGVHATSSRPRRRPEERAEAAVAIAGDAELPGACGYGSRSHETRNRWHGEKEGSKGFLTVGENEDGGGSRTADHAEDERRTLALLCTAVFAPVRTANAKVRRGGSREGRRRARR